MVRSAHWIGLDGRWFEREVSLEGGTPDRRRPRPEMLMGASKAVRVKRWQTGEILGRKLDETWWLMMIPTAKPPEKWNNTQNMHRANPNQGPPSSLPWPLKSAHLLSVNKRRPIGYVWSDFSNSDTTNSDSAIVQTDCLWVLSSKNFNLLSSSVSFQAFSHQWKQWFLLQSSAWGAVDSRLHGGIWEAPNICPPPRGHKAWDPIVSDSFLWERLWPLWTSLL